MTLARPRAMPDEELVRRADARPAGRGRIAGPDDDVDELARREAQRLTATPVRLTPVATILAAVVVLLALFALVLAAAAPRGG